MAGRVVVEAGPDIRQGVFAALDALGAEAFFARQTAVMLKPNLVNASGPPVTTPVAFCEAVLLYVREHSRAAITVAEGCGDARMETPEIFERLGYAAMARRQGVALLDLNHAPTVESAAADCPVFPRMRLPEAALNSCLVSLPVLKAHSLAGLTGALKNMMGLAPSEHYAGRYGSWKKAMFHDRMQQSILDLLRHVRPALSVMDASRGLADYHLGGRQLDPPPGKFIAGYDPWEVDRTAAGLLGLAWRDIRHVAEAPDRAGATDWGPKET